MTAAKRQCTGPQVEKLEGRYMMHHCHISFSAAAYFVSESAGSATITLTRTEAAGDVSNKFNAAPGTASADDFTPISGQTVTWLNTDENIKTLQVVITPDSIPEGAETINLSIDNFQGTFAGDITQATLTIVDDDSAAPSIGSFGGAISYTENASPTVISTGVTVADADSANFDNGQLTAAITANSNSNDRLGILNQGTGAGQIGVSGADVTFAGTTIGSFTGGSGSSPLVITLNSSATPANTQALARALTFSTLGDAPSTATRTLSLSLTDGDGGTSNTVTKSATVVAVNDAPTISGPSTQTTTTNTALVFSNSNSNALTVADPDAGAAQVQLALVADHGTITLITTTGLTFTTGANGESSFTVKGTLANINSGLNGLSFGVPLAYVGSASLQLTANDLGSAGTGGAKSGSKTVAIAVGQVVDNGTSGYAEVLGTWSTSGLKGYNNSSTRYSNSANAAATWTPSVPAGFYTIAIYKLASQASSVNAQLSVLHDGSTETQTVDLRAATAGFVELPGVFWFNSGTGDLVQLAQGSTVGNLRADAIRFTPVPAPVALIDNGTTGYAETGTWNTSGLTGYNNSSTRYSSATAATATWTPVLTAGYYQVSFYKVVNAASQANATVSVVHNGGTNNQSLNLTTGSSGFVDLGTFYFNGSGNERVRLSQTTAGTLRADAVRFTKVQSP